MTPPGLLTIAAFRSAAMDLDLCCEEDSVPWAASDDCAIWQATQGVDQGVGYGTLGYTLAELQPAEIRFVNFSVIFQCNGMRWCAKGGSVGLDVREIEVSSMGGDIVSIIPSHPYRSFIVPLPYGSLATWELALLNGQTVTRQKVVD